MSDFVPLVLGTGDPNARPSQTVSGVTVTSAAGTASTAGNYVAPYIAVLDASGTANLAELALSQQVVTITGVQQTFVATLSNDDAITLLNSFTVTGGVTNGLGDGNTTLAITLDTPIKAVLASAIADALNGSDKAVPAWLNDQLSARLTAHILSTLGLSVTATSSVTVDAAGAADNMKTGLAADSDILEALYLQIDQDTLSMYEAGATNSIIGRAPTTSALPMKKGDSITFVFDTTAFSVDAGITKATSNASDAAPAATAGAGGAGASMAPGNDATVPPYSYEGTSTLTYFEDSYRVAFRVVLGTGSGAFSLKAWSGATPAGLA